MRSGRWGATLGLLLLLSLWVGAQGPSRPLPAAAHVRLFQHHRVLVGTLVDHGLGLAASRTPLDRAEECRRTVHTLGQALQRAAEERDSSRLRQLAELLTAVVTDGLAPNLQEAAHLIPPESPESRRLRDIRDRSRAELATLRQHLMQEEGLILQPSLQNTLQRLTQAEERLRSPGEARPQQP